LPLWIYDVTIQPNIYDVRYNYYATDYKPKIIGHITNPIQHLNVYLFGGYLVSDIPPSGNNQFLINTILPIEEAESNIEVDTDSRTMRVYKETYKVTEIIETGWILSYSNYPLWIIAFWITIPCMMFNIVKNRCVKQSAYVLLGIITMFTPYIFIAMFRPTLAYYFIYTIPFIILGIVLAFDSIKREKIKMVTKSILLLFAIVLFVISFPLKILG